MNKITCIGLCVYSVQVIFSIEEIYRFLGIFVYLFRGRFVAVQDKSVSGVGKRFKS